MLENITKEKFDTMVYLLETIWYIISWKEPFYNDNFWLLSQEDFDKKYFEFYLKENKSISISRIIYNNLTEEERESIERDWEDIQMSFTQVIYNKNIISNEKLDIKLWFNN